MSEFYDFTETPTQRAIRLDLRCRALETELAELKASTGTVLSRETRARINALLAYVYIGGETRILSVHNDEGGFVPGKGYFGDVPIMPIYKRDITSRCNTDAPNAKLSDFDVSTGTLSDVKVGDFLLETYVDSTDIDDIEMVFAVEEGRVMLAYTDGPTITTIWHDEEDAEDFLILRLKSND